MKRLRFILIILFQLIAVISILLLLNVTAPNPTHRRYSSETPLTTGQAASQEIGASAERILSKDLGLPNNNDADQLQCICRRDSDSKRSYCRACLAIVQSVSSYRIPDFVGPNFIAESKNTQGLLYAGREVDQIRDYVAAARMLRRPLWVYVRTNTDVAPEFATLVNSTGGGLVYYFTVPGYADPIDSAGRTGLLVAGIGLILLVVFGRRSQRRFIRIASPSPKQPPVNDPLNKAVRKTETTEAFIQRSREHHRRQIDANSDD
jgi:hypothetical protein